MNIPWLLQPFHKRAHQIKSTGPTSTSSECHLVPSYLPSTGISTILRQQQAVPSFSKLKILPSQIKALQQQVYSCPLDRISSWPKLIFQTGCCCVNLYVTFLLPHHLQKMRLIRDLCVCIYCVYFWLMFQIKSALTGDFDALQSVVALWTQWTVCICILGPGCGWGSWSVAPPSFSQLPQTWGVFECLTIPLTQHSTVFVPRPKK